MQAFLILLAMLGGDPCSEAGTQRQINECRLAAFNAADAELNATWKKVLAAVAEEEAKPKLVEAQRMWVKFRDAGCRAEAAVIAGGGTLEPALYHDCRTRLTRERIGHLKEILEWREQ